MKFAASGAVLPDPRKEAGAVGYRAPMRVKLAGESLAEECLCTL